ncbi:GNAT family N-acetyltransferase [Candidatus Bipolaricaulota bacterium]|nr:GNAT family N-acetyltransferase [Candidatus Bipolaricaulota bacterium]
MKMSFMDGKRLYLRPLETTDIDRCMAWINDEEILQFLGRRHPMGLVQETEWLANQYKDEDQLNLAIVLKDGDRHIGNGGFNSIDHVNRSAVFGILIGEHDAWNQGYGSEAATLIVQYGFQELNLHRIELDVFSLNPRARRAYEKVGFKLEGTKRDSYFRHGAFHDTYVMSVLQSEWRVE